MEVKFFGWLIQEMSINQKSGWQTFHGRFVLGSVFISRHTTDFAPYVITGNVTFET